jgi:GT2 family glycosyltransferase
MAARLSILIPTRDRLQLLKESLASARAQTVADIEILVSDDGSSDATIDYIRNVTAIDSRVRLLTDNPVAGAFENIRHLVAHATAGALAVLGDDDILLPAFGERLVPALDDPMVDVAYCLFEAIGEDGKPLPRRTAELRRHHRYETTPAGRLTDPTRAALAGQLWLGSCVYRTEAIQRLGLDLRFGSAADWDLALRTAEQGGVVFVPEVLWRYRDHAGTISRASSARATTAAISVLESHRAATAEGETIRLDRLRALLASQAWKSVVTDPDLATASLRRYDDLAGRRLEPRRLLSALFLRLPPRLRVRLHDIAVASVTLWRALRQRVLAWDGTIDYAR